MTALRRSMAAACAIALIQGVFLASVIPPFAGPDEPAHFDFVQRLAEVGRLPDLRVEPCERFSLETRALESAVVLSIQFQPQRPLPPLASIALPDPSDPHVRTTTGCSPSATYPPLYYASAVVPYRAVHDAPMFERIFAARLASVAWGVAGTAFAFLLGWWWFGRVRDALLIAIVWMFQPMIAFRSSVTTNDSALFACSAASFAAIALAWRDRSRSALWLLAGAALCGALTKPTFAIFLPVIAASAAAALGPGRLRAWIATALALAPAGVAAVAWSVVTRPGMRYVLPSNAPPIPWHTFVKGWILDAQRLYQV